MKKLALFSIFSTYLLFFSSGIAVGEDFSNLAREVARGPQSDESVYFVVTDRFENGDPSNDEAGLNGGRLASGYEPTEPGWWHGGDLQGLTTRLPYIREMGFTAVWITPPVKQRYFQGSSAGYHGYWGVDFTTVDPHLGTENDFKEMVERAHDLGLKVIVDVVANHTADLIYYKLNKTEYLDATKFPYRTATGKAFKPAQFAGSKKFPQLKSTTSFPYIPQIAPFSKNEKKPSWLNDLTNYHNRGDSTFSGPSMMDGDFYGLDDLFTEKPEVVKGWIDVWSDWIRRYRIDGLRIDTFRHVNPEFWKAVIPEVLKVAKAEGIKDFPIFGEVADSNPQILSEYIQSHQVPSVLDFGFQKNISSFVRFGTSGNTLAEFFNSDDLYTTTSTSAYGLATFLGNHDMGRIGLQLEKAVPQGDSKTLLERANLANAALFLLRGGPTLYYGDEKGMIGTGGDRDARQDMFPTQVEDWKSETRIGQSPIGAQSSFDVQNPLHLQITELQKIIAANPALRYGTQQVQNTENGLLVFTRYLAGQEFLVALNGSDEVKKISALVNTKDSGWSVVSGADTAIDSSLNSIDFTLPPRTYIVLKAREKYLGIKGDNLSKLSVKAADFSSTLKEISVSSTYNQYLNVTFAYRLQGKKWVIIGTTDRKTVQTNQTQGNLYRIFFDSAQIPKGSKAQFVAVGKSAAGEIFSSPVK